MSDDLGVAWTDARNTYTDIYFSRAPSNLPPVAVAKPLYQEVSNGQTTWLYGNESYDTDGTIVNYSWQITGPSGPMQLWGDIVSFVPTAEGLHNATLTILDDGGLDDSTVVYVNVGFVPTLIPPVAEAGDNMVAFLSENVTFDGSASYDPDGSIIDYHWDFDDGTQASGTIVNHTFSSVGRYYVDLTVTDDDNLSDSDVVLVLVLDPAPYAPVLTRTTLTGASQSELTIEWELSSDDGSGFDDVINYAVYWSDSYDSSGAGYQFLTELPPGTTSLTLAGWGDGDWSDYFVYVQANDTDGYTNWEGQAGKFVRFMEAGKRIASVPLVQDDETLETVLQSLTGSYNHVRYYKSSDQSDHWKSYWTFKTYRTLFEINHKMGFWIQITKDDHLVVAGLVPEVTEIQLGHQWNLVGYPCFFDDSVGGALSAIDWTKIDGYSDTPPYHLRHLSPADIMTAGEGYWIWVDVPQVWMVEN
ncbi:MAG: PKD domain-containing protein [Thermoplasmata archaeon]|nr:PKD domain-containing protein [Thermoplasmata archaeon]